MRISSIFIICIGMLLPATLHPASTIRPANSTIDPSSEVYKKLSSLKISEIQKLVGRKLTLKEKASLWILKHTSGKKAEGKKGNTALIFGIVGAGLLLLGLFVPWIILGAIPAAIVAIILGSNAKRANPNDKNAQAATILGWITLGGIVLLLILAAIVAASWGTI